MIPTVLILDEPTDGLDPNQKHEVRTLIRKMGQTKAIIFSTHILEEVEAACSHAIIIDRGQIVANGTPEELKQRSEHAGAVTVRLFDGNSSLVTRKLNQGPAPRRSALRENRQFPCTEGFEVRGMATEQQAALRLEIGHVQRGSELTIEHKNR